MSSTLTNPGSADGAPSLENATIVTSNWLGWAAFLGASWTWCIGMFLPVILVRQYGFCGWVVFAVPNVIGAAAMGWVLRDARSSDEIATVHRDACALFSGVTIAFHLFFVMAVVGPLALSVINKQDAMDLAVGVVFAASVLMYVYMTHRDGGDRVLAWFALLISTVAMVFVVREISDIVATTPERMRPMVMEFDSRLLGLAPVCVFGFAFCPYLDLTFHRARQQTSGARASFGVGFGVMFFTMIIFSLIYSRAFASDGVTGMIAIFLFVHMAVQTAFTVAAHARELLHRGQIAGITAAVLTLASWIAYFFLPDHLLIKDLRAGEIIYRMFMGFYGLVFPAYVWLVMLPGRGRAKPTARSLAVFIVAVLIATPMFWMGFIMQQTIWLVPGLAVVLLSRVAVARHQDFKRGCNGAFRRPNDAALS